MAKKDKIIVQRDPDLEAINIELNQAMDVLDATLQRVDGVLREMAPAVETPPTDAPQSPPAQKGPQPGGAQ